MSAVEMWSEVMQWTVVLALAAVTVGLVYLVADLHRRLGPDRGALIPNDGLKVDSQAPDLGGQDLRTGVPVRLADHPGRAGVVAFLSPTCKPCVELVPHLNGLARVRQNVRLFVVTLPGHGYDYAEGLVSSITLIADADGELQKAWEVMRTPLVYVVDAKGTVKMKSVSNDLLDLEDTLDGIGWHQGDRPWVAPGGQSQASP